jgi:hypothetical protein
MTDNRIKPCAARTLRRHRFWLPGGLLLLGACAPIAGGLDFLPTRVVTWFGYADGADIRRGCTPGSADRLRLIYNAVFREQVRSYDIVREPGAGQAAVETRVYPDQGFQFSGAITIDPANIGANFQPVLVQGALSADELRGLLQALDQDGFAAPAPAGKELNSWDFFWIAAGCVNGQFRYHAWTRTDQGFAALRFPGVVQRLDRTGIRFNPVRAVSPPNDAGEDRAFSRTLGFSFRVGTKGLVGVPNL